MNNVKATIGNAFKKGVHPKVKCAARAQLKKSFKNFVSTKIVQKEEEFSCFGMEHFTSWYVDKMFDRYNGR